MSWRPAALPMIELPPDLRRPTLPGPTLPGPTLPDWPAARRWPVPTVERDASGALLQLVMHQREVANALAGGLGDRVHHGRRGDRNGRLADTAPKVAGR